MNARPSSRRRLALALAGAFELATSFSPASSREPDLTLTLDPEPPRLVFDAQRDGCDGHDVPDIPPRAYRDASGQIVMFAMHYENRALRGPDFDRLRLDCRVVFRGSGASDPVAYDDRAWIAATWTVDGKNVAALVHHEYQANHHKGRCTFTEYLTCWTNSVLAVVSNDGGASFTRPGGEPAIVASWPFRQETEQGRHRGFFNPSNIVSDGAHVYMFAATTGWAGQDFGACLFRNADPLDPAGWRAWDGTDFTARFVDPYRIEANRTGADPLVTCQPIAPFPAPVGSLARHRGTGLWVAVFQAVADGGRFPESGIYYAVGASLTAWSAPRLLMAGPTLYDTTCPPGGRLINYPALIDPAARGRNFDDVDDDAFLYLVTIRLDGCRPTSDRSLIRHRVWIVPRGR